jgi:hypothetical protein
MPNILINIGDWKSVEYGGHDKIIDLNFIVEFFNY